MRQPNRVSKNNMGVKDEGRFLQPAFFLPCKKVKNDGAGRPSILLRRMNLSNNGMTFEAMDIHNRERRKG